MARIFISYRRRESAFVAAPLSEKLQERFGEDSVFYDIDHIPLGVDFREHIANAVGQCDVLLVLIGEQWLTAADKTGNKRLNDPSDYVRIEIESALKRDIPIIPVLLGEATMPSADDLPEPIQDIVYRNAAELRAGTNWRQHIERLINGLETLFKSNKKPAEEAPKPVEKIKPEIVPESEPPVDKKPADIHRNKAERSAGAAQINKSKTDERSKVMQVIKSVLGDFSDSYFFIGKAIPRYKIDNAIAIYAPRVNPKDVLLLTDHTVFGGAKRGLILTPDAVYHNEFNKPFYYTQIKSAEAEAANLFGTATLLINGEKMEIVASEAFKLAALLAEIIRRLAKL